MSETATPTGLRIEGAYENDRNAKHAGLYKRIIREVFGVQDVIIAHHLVYVTEEKRADGFSYQVVEEIPAADTLIFDHDIARKLWGDNFKPVLCQLAMTPCEERDDLLAKLLDSRTLSHAAADANRVILRPVLCSPQPPQRLDDTPAPARSVSQHLRDCDFIDRTGETPIGWTDAQAKDYIANRAAAKAAKAANNPRPGEL